MSKYNHMKSIDISTIPKNELSRAIIEWSQGNKAMENLLWTCYFNGVETNGCHPLGNPYISFVVNNSHEQLRKILFAAQIFSSTSTVLIPDGAPNPIGADNWYDPDLGVVFRNRNRLNVESFLNTLQKSLVTDDIPNSEPEIFGHILDFHDFFADKDSQLIFYIEHLPDNTYEFSILPSEDVVVSKKLDDLFTSAGLKFIPKGEKNPPYWSLSSSNPQEFSQKLENCKNTILEGYNIERPTKIVKGMFTPVVLKVKQRQFGDSIDGKHNFDNWFRKYKFYTRLMYDHKISFDDYDSWLLGEMDDNQLTASIKNMETYQSSGTTLSRLHSAATRLKNVFKKLNSKGDNNRGKNR